MSKKSAGILLYRKRNSVFEFFLVHPGGPFWKNKDEGAWSIPKGEFDTENPFDAAIREFEEETGIKLHAAKFIELSPVKQKSGKIIYAWAIEEDVDETSIISNSFEMEFPPKSGKKIIVPEVDRAGWFNLKVAEQKIISAQFLLIKKLLKNFPNRSE